MTINEDIAAIFNNTGNMLEILGENPFKIRAYKNASATIKSLDRDLSELAKNNQLLDIKGIGKDLAKKINEFISTGRIEYYDELKSRVPEELLAIKSIQGIGPKLIQTLFNDFNVRNITDLEDLLSDPEFINQKGVGTKKINELKVGIKLFKDHLNKINLGIALPAAEFLCGQLAKIPEVSKAEISGEILRGKETVEIIHLVISCGDLNKVLSKIKNFDFIDSNSISNENSSFRFNMKNGIPVLIDVSDENNFITYKFISTGPEKHVDKVKKLYDNKEINFSEQTFSEEDELYSRVGIKYIPPELREGTDEFELPGTEIDGLVKLKDIKGDLHTHSTWSDGKSTIIEMADAARELGYKYIAITDHSVSSRIANGLDLERLKEKKKELHELDAATDGIKIIFGSEVDIKPDGSLDYPDEVLKDLDMVVASVHSSFKMNEKEMTERITKAMSNPYVCALGHPTGRLIGERLPYKVDMNAVIETALNYGKALEVNSSYMRLDLKDEHVRMAVDNGIDIIISTDAHHTSQLNQMRYGISTARRGRAAKKNVINTLSENKLLEWLNNFK